MPGCKSICLCIALIASAACGTAARADDLYFDLPISELDLNGGKLPDFDPNTNSVLRFDWRLGATAYATLEGPGECFLDSRETPLVNAGTHLVGRASFAGDVKGQLVVPSGGLKPATVLKFRLPKSAGKQAAREEFNRVKQAHFESLLTHGLPGGAWFRHQAILAGKPPNAAAPVGQPPQRGRAPIGALESGDLADTLEIFGGGRAVAENLQLDRLLRERAAADNSVEMVAVGTLQGIKVAAIDWAPLVGKAQPTVDPAARRIPSDQHAIFCSTFAALVQLIDEAKSRAALLNCAAARAEDDQTFQRYQRQLALPLDGPARTLGGKVIGSVAITGSDPYFATGTDVALIFEAADPSALENLLLAQITAQVANAADAAPVNGKAGTLNYRGFRSPDRAISTYVARLEGAVAVSNSTAQLERLATVISDPASSLAALPEYAFFRERYKVGQADETAFLFISDATIRRWCGPRWRIAASRRLRDLAVIDELQAAHLDEVVQGGAKPASIESDYALACQGTLRLTPAGVVSSTLGSLEFQTPIVELPLDQVTAAEAQAYNTWRDGYERNWRWAFDPIGLQISLLPTSAGADLTIMPLIGGSDYRQLIALSEGAHLKPGSGDPHAALAQLALAINVKNLLARQETNMATGMLRIAEPFGWLGETVSLYADEDPFWQELLNEPEVERRDWLEKHFFRLPIGLRFEVTNPLKLAAFLASVRAAVEQTAPGLVEWQALKHGDQPYVKIVPTEQGRGMVGPAAEQLAVFYAPTPNSLLFTLNEDLLKRALDRQKSTAVNKVAEGARPNRNAGDGKPTVKQAAGDAKAPAENALRPWQGDNVALHVDFRLAEIQAALAGTSGSQYLRDLSWSNLPILNEWHRLYPKQDPVELHQRVWHTRLVCPGGGQYVWNETFQTMESTMYGHPGDPKVGPSTPPGFVGFTAGDLGLSFENHGLRARVIFDRGQPASLIASPTGAAPAEQPQPAGPR